LKTSKKALSRLLLSRVLPGVWGKKKPYTHSKKFYLQERGTICRIKEFFRKPLRKDGEPSSFLGKKNKPADRQPAIHRIREKGIFTPLTKGEGSILRGLHTSAKKRPLRRTKKGLRHYFTKRRVKGQRLILPRPKNRSGKAEKKISSSGGNPAGVTGST